MGRTPLFKSREDRYSALVDFDFFESEGLIVEQAPKCPWQFFIKHHDLRSRFVYYPSTGTVVYEKDQSTAHAAKRAVDVYDFIMSKFD